MNQRARRYIKMERYMIKELLFIIAALTAVALLPLAFLITHY
jgi:hypothetical protein